ncbi:hypothetical protein [Aeromonas hydrophila]|uniref:hypothetical protein n=1 Tax=Aeromonas TaxID=642 RepID=UPI00366C90DD
MSISPMDLATYYGVDDIPAALSIGDNLHSLLVAIFRNEPLTSPRYDILASYDLNALRGFINGDMTLPEFRRQSAVEQELRRSKSLYYKGRKIVHRYQPSITKPLAAQQDDKPNIEKTSQNPTWDYLQKFRIKNGLADGQNSVSLPPHELAKQFWVDDITSAITGGARLHSLLIAAGQGATISAANRQFLLNRGLNALLRFLTGELSQEQFDKNGKAEQEQRNELAQQKQREIAVQKAVDEERYKAEQKARSVRLEAERIQRESDPKYIARMKNQALREKYGVTGYVESHHLKQLMAILLKLDAGTRLLETETIWLKSNGREFETKEILHTYNRFEADHWLAEYRNSKNPWSAVNASGHLRKCAASNEAIALLSAIPAKRQGQPKLKSAILTTHGGAMRDRGEHTAALNMGAEAHRLQPNNFRPCTLLGAVCIELGNISEGHEWYCKAEARGAGRDSIMSDVRSLLTRMTADKREAVIAELLRIHPEQYRWLTKWRQAKA